VARIRIAATASLAVALAVLLAGCGLHQDFDPPEPGGMKPGPGLFSGEDGVFTILGRDWKREPESPDSN